MFHGRAILCCAANICKSEHRQVVRLNNAFVRTCVTKKSTLRTIKKSTSCKISSTASLPLSNAITSHSDSEETSAVDITWPIEEETLPNYRPEAYFPVRIGQTFLDRYRVVGKLGYGVNSTVWLSWDESSNRYCSLKIYKRGTNQARNEVNREINIYKHIAAVNSSHPGKKYVRSIWDKFQIPGPHGKHWCLVHEPLWESCEGMQQAASHPRFAKEFVRDILKGLLSALDYLHRECHVVHADIKAGNILWSVVDQSIFAAFEEDERQNPTPFKLVEEGRRIYCSRYVDMPEDVDLPILTDFGNSYLDSRDNDEACQPWQYRAPEVILQMPWSYEIDIWSVGVLIWQLFENKMMFQGIDQKTGDRSSQAHLAEMVGYLGEPPLHFLKLSPCYKDYFDDICDDEGEGFGQIPPDYPVPNLSLRRDEENLAGREKDMFLELMGKMLKWIPEQRATAKELLHDPWLNGEPRE